MLFSIMVQKGTAIMNIMSSSRPKGTLPDPVVRLAIRMHNYAHVTQSNFRYQYGKGTNMVQLTYANQGWRCTSPTLSKHLCSTRSVWVFKRCSESVWKVHKRHAWSTQKVSSRYQAVNHLRDYFSWITSRRQAQFLADLYLS